MVGNKVPNPNKGIKKQNRSTAFYNKRIRKGYLGILSWEIVVALVVISYYSFPLFIPLSRVNSGDERHQGGK